MVYRFGSVLGKPNGNFNLTPTVHVMIDALYISAETPPEVLRPNTVLEQSFCPAEVKVVLAYRAMSI